MNLFTDLKNSLVSSSCTDSGTDLGTKSGTSLDTSLDTSTNIQDQEITATFRFSGNLDLFAGHFPGNPILPGIVQIEMVKFVVEQAWGNPFWIRSTRKTKFANLIHPDTPVHLSIRLTPVDDVVSVAATLKTEDKTAGKINLILQRK